jgi:hypothetical protein
MRQSRQDQVRAILSEYPDGADALDLMLLMRLRHGWPGDLTELRRLAKPMVDVYIDRWVVPPRGHMRPIYVKVEVPDDCPKPVRPALRGR